VYFLFSASCFNGGWRCLYPQFAGHETAACNPKFSVRVNCLCLVSWPASAWTRYKKLPSLQRLGGYEYFWYCWSGQYAVWYWVILFTLYLVICHGVEIMLQYGDNTIEEKFDIFSLIWMCYLLSTGPCWQNKTLLWWKPLVLNLRVPANAGWPVPWP